MAVHHDDPENAQKLLDDCSHPIETTHAHGYEHVQIDFNSVTYTVNKGKKNEKTILNDVACSLRSGELAALMGPSGAGKTTFLNILLQNAAHCQEGTVTVNGFPVTTAGFSKITNYVPQEDVMLTALSPSESLNFMASLRLGGTKQARQAKIDQLLDALGLRKCMDTPVGTVENRGLSGGERKRLSIAMELIDDPAVLVLDEPTTGLDSKAAEDVIRILEKLAREGRLVLATIHQPSWAVLELFQRLLMLASGQMVYDGTVHGVIPYFESLGQMMPKNANPIDHIMRIIQEDKPDEAKLDTWSSVWASTAEAHQPALLANNPPWSGSEFAISPFQQFKVLYQRESLNFLKDKEQCVQNVVGKIAVGTLVGLCWCLHVASRSPNETAASCRLNAARPPEAGSLGSKVFTVSGALFMIVNNCLLDDLMTTVIGFPTAKAVLHREIKNGVYGIVPWFLAYWILGIFKSVVFALMLTLPVYLLVGLRLDTGGEHMFMTAGTLVLCSMSGTTLGLAVGSCCKDVIGAIGLVMPTIIPMMIFGGFVIPFAEIPIAFKWIYWISPFQYAFNILRVNQFHNLDFQDDGCTDGHHDPDSSSAFSIYCNGDEYLDTLDFDIRSVDFMRRAFLLLGAVGMVCFVIAFAIVKMKSQQKTG